jgi:hypothetical protein
MSQDKTGKMKKGSQGKGKKWRRQKDKWGRN